MNGALLVTMESVAKPMWRRPICREGHGVVELRIELTLFRALGALAVRRNNGLGEDARIRLTLSRVAFLRGNIVSHCVG